MAAYPPVNRLTASLPRYVQIAESLLDQIESGQLRPGQKLPSERELSQLLGVNRLTVRRALRVVQSRGLLVRRQGDGTYVAEPKIERQAGRLISFTLGMQRRGLRPGAKLIHFEQRPVESSLAGLLGLPISAPVYAITRLRLLNDEPVMLELYTIPAQRFPGLERHDLEGRSLYEILRTEYGVAVRYARQTLEPVVAAEYEAELLGVDPGAPLMLEWRVSYDDDDRPVEHGRDLYRGDRFRFLTETAPLEL
jgi:GntR family transcriptional regulator